MPNTIERSPDDWQSPADSLADRFPTRFRSRASTQGVLVTTGPKPRQIFWESLGEFGTLVGVLARRDIVEVREQQEAVYRDAEGVVRRHFFDFVITFEDGTRRALAYKPRERAEKVGFVEFLTDLAGRISPEVADEIVPLTEFDLPRRPSRTRSWSTTAAATRRTRSRKPCWRRLPSSSDKSASPTCATPPASAATPTGRSSA